MMNLPGKMLYLLTPNDMDEAPLMPIPKMYYLLLLKIVIRVLWCSVSTKFAGDIGLCIPRTYRKLLAGLKRNKPKGGT